MGLATFLSVHMQAALPTKFEEVSATRKNIGKALHITSLASILPAQMVGMAVYGITRGAATTMDNAKAAAVLATPAIIQIIADMVAKSSTEDRVFNLLTVLAMQGSLFLMNHPCLGKVSKSIVALGKSK